MENVLGILTGMLAIVLIFGAPPALIVLIYYFSRKAKHKERMALIEKGIDASIFIKEETTFHKVLMWGMLIGGIGFGLLLGYILSVYTPMKQEIIMPIMALLFGGLGLIGYYVYRKKTETKSAQ
jgi:ABC-type Mn2+/Zn2+ transport system permease subunit